MASRADGGWGRAAAVLLLAAAGEVGGAQVAATAPRAHVALAGVDLPDVGGPAGYRGGVAIVALDDRPLGRLAVSDRIGRCVRRLDPVVAAGVTTWTWDGRDEQGVPVLSGSWLVRLETSSGPRTATLGQSPITRGRVTLRIFATAGR